MFPRVVCIEVVGTFYGSLEGLVLRGAGEVLSGFRLHRHPRLLRGRVPSPSFTLCKVAVAGPDLQPIQLLLAADPPKPKQQSPGLPAPRPMEELCPASNYEIGEGLWTIQIH